MFIRTAAPPKRAAAPTAPCREEAAPVGVELAVELATGPVVEGLATPLVKGTSEADEAPGKAAVVVVALGLGVAEAAWGLRTLFFF